MVLPVQRSARHPFGQYFGFLKAGASYRTREKSYDATTLVYGGYDDGSGDDLTLAGFAQSVDYRWPPISVRRRDLRRCAVSSTPTAPISNSMTRTRCSPAPGMIIPRRRRLLGLSHGLCGHRRPAHRRGVRVEDTQFDTTGNQIDEDLETVTSVSAENDVHRLAAEREPAL
jgi:hypothetical protein